MASLNRVQLIGNLGKDPELRYTKTQTPFARFSLATTEEYTNSSGERQKNTQWHNLVVWGKQAEIADRYLRKGKQVYVEGRIEYRDYEDQSGQKRYITDIKVDRFLMLGSRSEGGDQRSESAPESYDRSGGGYDVPESDSFNDDDIPF
ncbi:MAG: single-stranded DNA-binding protein [Acidobacteria bacterium]|nr:single-stranded DNA-binding protein [Acidobacteriota bacterium]